MTLTQQGMDLNWLQMDATDGDPLPRLPTLAASDQVTVVKPLTVVLATADLPGGATAPAVVYHPYGIGRVVAVEGAGMWRWAFLPPEFKLQENAYSSLWQSMMRWLTADANLKPGQSVSLRADRIRFSADEPATATLLAREDKGTFRAPSVELTRTDVAAPAAVSARRTFAPTPLGMQAGVFRIDFGTLPEGHYQAKVSGARDDDVSSRIIFDVKQFDQEDVDLVARPDLMERIASESGGAVLSSDDVASELDAKFKEAEERAHPPMVEYSSAWDRWPVLLGALGLWCTSWAIRRAGGLI